MNQIHPSNQYGRYCVPAGLEARPAAKAVLAGGVYEPETIAFMRAHAGGGDVIHAGTFFGDFLPGVAAALAPGAMLWAFEPNPGSCACARETIALNGLQNVTLTNAGLSNREEEMHFRTHDAAGAALGGLSHFTDAPGPGVTTVQTAMLDFAIPRDRKVSILQLDVEGHEKQALKGAYHLLHRCKPILILENHGNETWVQRSFRGLGYEKRGKLHGNFVYATTDLTV
ncbi:FkbM family methyltransferase [Alloyangia pacifica]|uniref:FkbM family methyltransferase n=1 Tax=Alloyangia pacifica TaxID=311180 RepID=UPI001CD41F11|nr:FkbM family methyltransferase [Alloyangia pacifica]MCA0995325.1 FkbM family methyltransferase [Alloyangia pacifica]